MDDAAGSEKATAPAASVAPRLFVIHAAEDGAFVEGFLLPALALPAEAVLRSSRLELGAPIVQQIERGALSPLTVVVLSPAFLDSPWGLFAELLAQHQSIDGEGGGRATVIPAIVADCDLPLLSRFRVPLDFRSPDREQWEAEAARLRARLAAPAPVAARPRCPYPGMRHFTTADAAHFHGREREVDDLIARLRAGERELYLIGSSGSGKSSLIAAGLVPRLASSAALIGARYLVHTLRPGVAPLAALAAALAAPAPADPATTAWLDAAISGLLATHAEHDRVLLVIDQLEELFATAPADAQAELVTAVRALRGRADVVLLFALRADFYGALLDSALTADLDGRLPRLDVRPLTGEALERAIATPARGAGVYLEPALLRELAHDAASEPGTLPLLQETLVYLWERLTRNLLRLSDYRAMGDATHTGLAVTVKRVADSALATLSAAHATIARRVFLRLVHFGEGRPDTRRQQPRAVFDTCGDAADVDAVLDHLVRRRLLIVTADDDPAARVDLAHEVLLSAWPTLVDWTRQRRTEEQRRRGLEIAAAEWSTRRVGGRDDVGLLDDGELHELDGWLSPATMRDIGVSAEVTAFITASRVVEWARAADREARAAATAARLRRSRRKLFAVIAGLAVVAVALSLLAVYARGQTGAARGQRLEVERQRVELTWLAARLQQRLGDSYLEQGRQALLVEQSPLTAISYLTAAREHDHDGFILRMLFAQATHNLWTATLPHRAAVRSAAFSPDGAWVVTASDDQTAQIWEVATGRARTSLVHDAAVRSAAFSPDGAQVATRDADGRVKVWDAVTGTVVPPRPTTDGWATAAAFSPDGARVEIADCQADLCAETEVASFDSVSIWTAPTGLPRTLALDEVVTAAALSLDGARLLTISWDLDLGVTAATARIWRAGTGEALTASLAHHDVRAAAFSPDGTRVVTASGDNTARIWAAEKGRAITEPWRELTPPLVHGEAVLFAAFSPDGARVVTASADRTARIWDADTGRALTPPLAHGLAVNSAAFSPDGMWVVTASDDGTARIWDAATGHEGTPPLTQGAPDSVAFTPDGTRVVVTSRYGTPELWDVATAREVTLALGLDAPAALLRDALPIALGPDGARALIVDGDGLPQVWDLAAPAARRPPGPSAAAVSRTPLRGHRGTIYFATFSPDGARIVTASEPTARAWDTAQVWDAATGAALTQPLVHGHRIRSAVLSGDGARVVTIEDATAWVSAVGTTAPRLVLEHDGSIRSAAFSLDGRVVVTAGDDGTARIWTASGPPLVLRHDGPVRSAVFSPDGTRVVTAGEDGIARIWDAGTGLPLARLAHGGRVNSVAFSSDPESLRVLTASEDRTARVWDATTGRALTPPLVHDDAVGSAAFSPDGALVVTASHDTVRVWDVSPDEHSRADWQALADSHGHWTQARGPRERARGEAAAPAAPVLRFVERTPADDVARASNLIASAYRQLPHDLPTARALAAEAARLDHPPGRDGPTAAQTCLAIIAILEHDRAAARRWLGASAFAVYPRLEDRLAAAALAATHRPALAAAILAAVR